MSKKRSHDESTSISTHPQKKPRKGFAIGPQNLPDGTYKRKVDKIRRTLVENAKVRKSYDKLKAREANAASDSAKAQQEHEQGGEDQNAALNTRHPERQALLDADDANEHDEHGAGPTANNTGTVDSEIDHRRKRRPKQQLYQREQRAAETRKQESDRRQESIEASRAEREKRLAERERWRRTIKNARGDGRRRTKLGKESTVLLEKVRRMIGSGETVV